VIVKFTAIHLIYLIPGFSQPLKDRLIPNPYLSDNERLFVQWWLDEQPRGQMKLPVRWQWYIEV